MMDKCNHPICRQEGGCMFPQACPDDAPEKPARPSDAAACSAGNSCGERLKELQDAGRAIVEAWDFDEVGQIDGELIENMRRLIDPQNWSI